MTIEEAIDKLTPEELEVLNSDDQLLSQFKAKYGGQTSQFPVSEKKTQGLFGTSMGEQSDLLRKARIPAQGAAAMSIGMMDAIEPEFQSVPLNAAIRAPQTLASIGSELVSSAIEPESLAMQGALKALPLLSRPANAIGRFVGNTLEKGSGLAKKNPGILGEVVTKDPALPWRMGSEDAGKLYDKVKDAGEVRKALKFVSEENPSPLNPKLFVRRAMQYVKDGSINPKEALRARQELDSIKNQLADDAYHTTRDIFDKIAKTKFDEADKAFAKGMKSDALTNFWGINAGGSPSMLKQGATLAYPVTGPIFSPLAQSSLASGLGYARQAALPLLDNPMRGGVGLNALRRRYTDDE